MKSSPVRFYLMGERAVVAHAQGTATLDCQRRIWWMAAQLRAQLRFIDVVPGMNNLTLIFDPETYNGETLLTELAELWQHAGKTTSTPNEVLIPVHYGGADGPDLEAVARHTGLNGEEVIAAHSAATYVVYFLGFQPGFAYMGGLPPELATPRRAEPRLQVPPGSVGIGGAQTGIYPTCSPGGWHLIGRTALQLFDPARAPSSLLQPGDTVRFVAESPHA
jgi:KipI family sensor histidine kinase inhibitor